MSEGHRDEMRLYMRGKNKLACLRVFRRLAGVLCRFFFFWSGGDGGCTITVRTVLADSGLQCLLLSLDMKNTIYHSRNIWNGHWGLKPRDFAGGVLKMYLTGQ